MKYRAVLMVLVCLGLNAGALAFANANRPIQEDGQKIDLPVVFVDHTTEAWSNMLASATGGLGVTNALLPNMVLAQIDPNNPIPNYGPYPHVFQDGDNVSFTMLDRAISQQELVKGQQQVIQAIQAQTAATTALTTAVQSIQTELVTSRAQTGLIATHIETLATNGVNVTVQTDNASLIAALQQLLQTLQTGQSF